MGLCWACRVAYFLAVGSDHGGSIWNPRDVGAPGAHQGAGSEFSQVLPIGNSGPVPVVVAERQDGSILGTRVSQLCTWVLGDSRPSGRAHMLAGREGNGTVVHFLGSTRNSQGELLTLALLCVCLSLNLSSLACLFLTLSLLLPAAIPGRKHHQAGRSPGKCNQSPRLISASRPPGGVTCTCPIAASTPCSQNPSAWNAPVVSQCTWDPEVLSPCQPR